MNLLRGYKKSDHYREPCMTMPEFSVSMGFHKSTLVNRMEKSNRKPEIAFTGRARRKYYTISELKKWYESL